MAKLACFFVLGLMLAACSAPPKKPTVPSLTPEAAAQLLHYNGRAETWLEHVKKQNSTCEYLLTLPDQTTHPTELDLKNIVYCGGQPAPLEYNASVIFSYDKDKGQWVITRFSS